jgi:antitoxin YefM
MPQVSYSDLRQNLSDHMDAVVESRAPLLVTRQGGRGNVVMIAEAEFDSWQETLHLLRSPVTAARLLRSIAEADDGKAVERGV